MLISRGHQDQNPGLDPGLLVQLLAAKKKILEPTVLWAQNVHLTGFRAPFSLFMVNIVEYYWQSTVEPVIWTN